MKPINTRERWTGEDRQTLKRHIRHLISYVPVLMIFLLPGGSLLLPFLAELLDRRKKTRLPEPESETEVFK